MEPISKVPVVKTRRSQLGSVADNMPAELLPPAVGPELGADDVAVVLVLWKLK
jgi:hypothetical protein